MNKLKKEWPRVSINDLESIMQPRSDFDGVIKCDPIELFNLELIEIGNLYRADKKFIKLRHESSLVISKCEGEIKDSLAFSVDFENQSFLECGINYLGRIRILHKGEEPIPIKIFGEGSYDPAAKETYLSKHDYIVTTGFLITALYACKRGGSENYVDKVFAVAMHNPACINHPDLMDFLKYQVKSACFHKEAPMDYAFFLRKYIERPTRVLLEKRNEGLLDFLYLLETIDRIEIFPCRTYLDALERERKVSHEIINFAKSTPGGFIRTDTKFIGNIFSQRFIDMRNLEDMAYDIEKNYSKKIAKALEARGDNTGASDMEKLRQQYYKCVIF